MQASLLRRLAALFALLLACGGVAAAAPPSQPPVVVPDKADQRLSGGLLRLHQEYLDHLSGITNGTASAPFRAVTPLVRVAAERVAIDAIAAADPQRLLADLQALGLERGSVAGFLVSGRFPIAALPALATLDSLAQARVSAVATNKGLTTSQADVAMAVAAARSTYGLDGSGVTVGTLSDSYACAATAATTPAQDVASGDLPAGIVVLRDYTEPDCIDEGRAMMQLIHDLAPGAQQKFHTAFEGEAGFANGIVALADAGAGVIVDDVIYFAEPMFQDGVIAQAVDQVAARGVMYFSSAGNNGRDSYSAPLRLAQQVQIGNRLFAAHDFDPGSSVDSFLRLELPPFSDVVLSFQWDDPFRSVSGPPGAANDLDLYFSIPSGSRAQVGQQGNDPNLGLDPLELAVAINNTGTAQPIDILIVRPVGAAGPPPTQIKIVAFGSWNPLEYNTNSSTVYGHANARGAVAVGASAFFSTPAFGQSPPLLNNFSSAGRTPIYFGSSGQRLAAAELRPKPEITAVDGTNTTFFGDDVPQDADSFPNFFGTSAAAPHAAAVAALMRQAYPPITTARALELLQETAINIGPPGFDDDSGAGLIQADRAIARLLTADLALTGQVAPFAAPASPLTYTLTLANNGPAVALGATITQTLPAGAAFVAAQATAGSCSAAAGQVVCTVGDLAAGGLVTGTIRVTTPATSTLVSSATAAGRSADPLPANNTTVLTTSVFAPEAAANLTLSNSTGPARVDAGAPISYTLRVTNTGPALARAVTLSVTLPAQATFVSAAGDGWSCQPPAVSLVCTRSNLAVATAPALQVTLRAPGDGGRLDLDAQVRSSEPTTSEAGARVTLTTQVFIKRYLPLLRR